MLSLMCLDGQEQGESFTLFEGFTLSSESEAHLQIKIDSVYQVNAQNDGTMLLIANSDSEPMKSGGGSSSQLILIPGLIFSIGDETFAVQNVEDDSKSIKTTEEEGPTLQSLIKKLSSLQLQNDKSTPKAPTLLEKPVKFQFVRGLYINSDWKIPYVPISFGKKSALKFFVDDSVNTDEDFLTLKKGSSLGGFILSTPFEKLVFVNGEPVNETEVFDGDFVEFGQTAFYINIDV